MYWRVETGSNFSSNLFESGVMRCEECDRLIKFGEKFLILENALTHQTGEYGLFCLECGRNKIKEEIDGLKKIFEQTEEKENK